jgi:hypothetical protein
MGNEDSSWGVKRKDLVKRRLEEVGDGMSLGACNKVRRESGAGSAPRTGN